MAEGLDAAGVHRPGTPAARRGRRGAAVQLCRYAVPGMALLALAGGVGAKEAVPVSDPSRTTYGEISAQAPADLRVFAFLIGKWTGKGKTRLQDGTEAGFPVTWIGRYILDGTAIADEMHAPAPDGSPYLGISFRQYDRGRKTWIIEYLNVTGSFLRKQVNGTVGSVDVDGRNVTVASESPGVTLREHYLVPDGVHFTYRLDVSNDGGKSWNRGQIEMTLQRVE